MKVERAPGRPASSGVRGMRAGVARWRHGAGTGQGRAGCQGLHPEVSGAGPGSPGTWSEHRALGQGAQTHGLVLAWCSVEPGVGRSEPREMCCGSVGLLV